MSTLAFCTGLVAFSVTLLCAWTHPLDLPWVGMCRSVDLHTHTHMHTSHAKCIYLVVTFEWLTKTEIPNQITTKKQSRLGASIAPADRLMAWRRPVVLPRTKPIPKKVARES